jgi:hypothetical protein
MGTLMSWYFRPTWWLPFKLVLFAWLVYALIYELVASFIGLWALARAYWAVVGSANAFIALLIGLTIATPVFGFVFMPVGLYVAQLSGIPDEWRKTGSRRAKLGGTLAWVIAVGLVGILIGWIVSAGTAFIADLNPCEAFKAGVTGNRMPGPGCA